MNPSISYDVSIVHEFWNFWTILINVFIFIVRIFVIHSNFLHIIPIFDLLSWLPLPYRTWTTRWPWSRFETFLNSNLLKYSITRSLYDETSNNVTNYTVYLNVLKSFIKVTIFRWLITNYINYRIDNLRTHNII